MSPGWMTTEFWMNAGMWVLTIFVTTGVITPNDRGTLEGIVANTVTGTFLLIGAVTGFVAYVKNRQALKQQHMQQTFAAMFPPPAVQTTVVNLPHVVDAQGRPSIGK